MSIDPGRADDAGAHAVGRTDPTAGRTGTARLGEDVGGRTPQQMTDPTAGVAASARDFASESARSVADPAPLGLCGFALTTFLLSLVNAGLVAASVEVIVLSLALAYGGLAQFLAGMWEFRKGNTFGATAFASYGAFWISFWFYVTFLAARVPAPARGEVAGWYLVGWGIFTFLMLIASFRTTAALVLVFALLTATFILLGVGNLQASTGLVKFGGYVGLATAAAAWYTALAAVVTSTFGKAVLPNPPLNRA